MKQLLSNQNIIEKLKRTLNDCLKKFYDGYNKNILDEKAKENILKEGNIVFTFPCSQQDVFTAQIQAYDLKQKYLVITDGIIKYKVHLRQPAIFDKASFFDTPHNSVVIVRKWSYEIVYSQNSFSINFVVEEMRCIDIITTIFYCKLEIDFTDGYKGISKSAQISTQVHDFSLLYFKALQLLKQYLIHDTFLSEYYNSTKTKSQPKLLILSTLKSKPTISNIISQVKNKSEGDFGEGCLLQKKYALPQTSAIGNEKEKKVKYDQSKYEINTDYHVSQKKRRLLPQNANQEIILNPINLQKQIKPIEQIEIDNELEDVQFIEHNQNNYDKFTNNSFVSAIQNGKKQRNQNRINHITEQSHINLELDSMQNEEKQEQSLKIKKQSNQIPQKIFVNDSQIIQLTNSQILSLKNQRQSSSPLFKSNLSNKNSNVNKNNL